MSDIVERLRNRSFRLATRDFNGDGAKLAKEAADEIVRLRLALSTARADGMEEAARIVDHLNGWGSDNGRGGHAEHFAAAIRRAKESKG